MKNGEVPSFRQGRNGEISEEKGHTVISRLKSENSMMKNILNGSSQGVMATSLSGDILFANARIKAYLRIDDSLKDLKGLMLDDGSALLSGLESREDRGASESRIIRHGGRVFRLIREPLTTENVIIFYVSDLTDIYAMRKTITGNVNYINNLITLMNYEINNPLQRIGMLTEMLPKETSGMLEGQIEAVMDDIRDIDNALSGFSRSVSDNPYLFKRFDPAQLIRTSLQVFKYKAEEKGLTITLDNPRELPAMLGNHDSLRQSLVNIISNAVDACDPGGEIILTAGTEGGSILITVSDNGKGISQGEIHSIFEPFYSTKEERSGLGLTIAARIIFNHLGTISVKSTKGQGTSVGIRLPVRSENQPSLTYTSTAEEEILP